MKTTLFFSFISLLGCTSLLSGCADSSEPTSGKEEENFVLKERQDIALTSIQKNGVDRQNDFALELFKASAVGQQENTLISPLSINIALSMLANGANEDVKQEIVDKLLNPDGNIEDLNVLNKHLSEALTEVDNSTTFTLSNSVWTNEQYTLLPAFNQTLANYYDAEGHTLNMYSSSAAGVINDWVNRKTHGLIPSVLDLPPACDFLIINTSYFKGKWTVPFSKETTTEMDFYGEAGESVKSDFMKADKTFQIAAITPEFTGVVLPYGNRAFQFIALLPSREVNFDEFIGSLSSSKMSDIEQKFTCEPVNLSIPKFETKYRLDNLHGIIKQAGIGKLFKSQISQATAQYPVSSVEMRHQVVFKIDESGAEGASYVDNFAVIAPGQGGESPTYLDVTFDRPFVYLVKEQSTGAILFIGTVKDL